MLSGKHYGGCGGAPLGPPCPSQAVSHLEKQLGRLIILNAYNGHIGVGARLRRTAWVWYYSVSSSFLLLCLYIICYFLRAFNISIIIIAPAATPAESMSISVTAHALSRTKTD